MRWPGIEPGSIAWKATMLTIIPPTLLRNVVFHIKSQTMIQFALKGHIK